MMSSLFPHIGTYFTPFRVCIWLLTEAFIMDLICLLSREIVQPLNMDKPWVWLLCSVRVVEVQLWLIDPWCKEIRSCSKRNAICFENDKTTILVKKFWCCRGDWGLSENVEPRDTGEVLTTISSSLRKGCEVSLNQDPSATLWHLLVLSPLKSDMLDEKPSKVVSFCELTWWLRVMSLKL